MWQWWKAERRAASLLKYWTCLIVLIAGGSRMCPAQEPAYFVTYSQVLEEPGSLELEFNNLAASPTGVNAFYSPTLELEYGVKAWWTSEFYVQGQSTANDSALFTGFRFENRFRPIPRELPVNPLFYIEYEDINGADRSLLEVVGKDGAADLSGPNRMAKRDVERELELKLLLSSYVRSWNVSENFIAEKHLHQGEPWEFGYALGVSRPLANYASAHECLLCRQSIAAGAEIYRGLGTTDSFGLRDTSHYAGPLLRLDLPGRAASVAFSPQFGLNGNSVPVLWRFKLSYEIKQARELFAERAWR